MASLPKQHTIQVEVHGDTSQIREELEELEIRAKVISTKPGSQARMDAYDMLSRYYGKRYIEAARRHADLCPWYDPRRYVSLLGAWRRERQLAS